MYKKSCLVLDVKGHAHLGGLFKICGIEKSAECKLGILLNVLLIQDIDCSLIVQPDLGQGAVVQPLLVSAVYKSLSILTSRSGYLLQERDNTGRRVTLQSLARYEQRATLLPLAQQASAVSLPV